MKTFLMMFNNAMELIVLGLYEKKQIDKNLNYRYSPLLKKGLDKFALINLAYFENKNILPTNENELIEIMNKPIINLIEKLPYEYKELIKNKSEWDLNSEFISTTMDCNYYIEEDLNDLIFGNRKFRKSINNIKNPEFELECQKFFDLIIQKTQEEYIEIRNFLEQRNHTYLTNSMLLDDEDIRNFNRNYKDIMNNAYERLPYSKKKIKICSHCNLVLKEKDNGELYCISERCSKQTKGFSKIKEIEIAEEIFTLKDSVAYSIYYFGQLEQEIKNILEKYDIEYKLWPEFDKYDFEISIGNKKWAIDAKNVKNYKYIIDDINEMSKLKNEYDNIFYVVPNYKPKYYLETINKNIRDFKYKCITVNRLEEIIKNKGDI